MGAVACMCLVIWPSISENRPSGENHFFQNKSFSATAKKLLLRALHIQTKNVFIATMNAFDRPSRRRVRSQWPASCGPALPEVIGFLRQESSRLIENNDSFQKMFLSTLNSYLATRIST